MSEDEIVKKLNELISWKGKNVEIRDYEIEAIQGLLDLYNKEKEKREIAEENHKVLSLDLGKALKELGLYEDTIIADELVLEINKRYISKDKIRYEIFHYNQNASEIEQNNMFRPAISKEQFEIDKNRAIARALLKLLEE